MINQRESTIFIIILNTFLAFVKSSNIYGDQSDIGLLGYMARSNDLLQQDPVRSLNCFNKYIPLISQIAKNYETNYKTCLNESVVASERADTTTLDERNELANAAEAACALLKRCQDNNSVQEIFQCFIDGGSANIQTMYIINANASLELAALREQYYLIQNKEYKCTNETKRAYEKKSSEAYAGLNNCILGNSESVTKDPSATSEITTKTTTEVTEKTAAVEPETSDNPIISSIMPENSQTGAAKTTTQHSEGTSSLPITITDKSSETTQVSTESMEPIISTIRADTTEVTISESPEE